VERLQTVVKAFVPGALAGLLASAGAFAAEPAQRGSVWLEVVREPGSAACPDAARVLSTAAALFPDQPLQAAARADAADLRVTVSVRPEGSGHLARLLPHGTSNAERNIADPDPACAGLAEALAVALVVWKGSQSTNQEAESAEAAAIDQSAPAARTESQESPPAPAAAEPSARDTPGSRTRRPFRLGVEAAAIGGFGLLGEPSVGASAGLSVWSSFGVATRLRLLRAVASPFELTPGSVAVDLWAGLFAGCFRFQATRRWSLSPCLELGWGRQHAEAQDLVSGDEDANAAWAVLGPSLAAVFVVSEPVAVLATGTLFGRLHDQKYLVDGAPVARQPSFGGYLGLGLVAEWSLPAESTKASDRRTPVVALKTDRHAP
jgi:hypothetical protein